MSMAVDGYVATKSCAACGHNTQWRLSEAQAAFEALRPNAPPCSKCGSAQCNALSFQIPRVSAELLELWLRDDRLLFSSQDEDLTIAQSSGFPLILEYLGRIDAPPKKRRVLLSSLFILAFESSDRDPLLLSTVLEALNQRRALVQELGIRHIYDYVLDRVLPMLPFKVNRVDAEGKAPRDA